MTRGTAHDDDEVPSSGGARIFHEILHKIAADLARSLEAKSGNLAGQRQIIVDGFPHVANANAPARRFGHLARREHGVVAANGGEITDVKIFQGFDDAF